MDRTELEAAGFRWPVETVLDLADGSRITVTPDAYRRSSEADAPTARAAKLLRLYRVTLPDGAEKEMNELEIERIL